MAKLWEKTKHAASSVTDKVSNAVSGPKHRTKDEHFNEIAHKFEEQRKRLEALQKDVNGFLSTTDDLLAAMESVALAGISVSNTSGPLKAICELEIATVKRMREDKKNHLEPHMQEQFIRPLMAYLGQYSELHSRIGDRSKRKDEMDKLKEKRDHYQEKNDPKLADVLPKYDVARQAYDDLNDELMKDMPLLMEDTEKFFTPLVALFISNKNKYIQAMNAHTLTEALSLDPAQARIPAIVEVITPKASSAITRQYQASQSSYLAPAPAADPNGPSPRPAGVSPRTSTATPSAGYPYGQPSGAQPGLQPPPSQPSYAAAPSTSPRGSSYMGQAAPPPMPARAGAPPPLPVRTPQARALWDFTGQPGELSFKAGEIINILTSQGDWWQGEIPGRGRGMLPSNYVQMI